jgi:hypothetical protein
MTTIQIDDTVAAALQSQAETQGISLQELLRRLADPGVVSRPKPLTVEEFQQIIDEVSSPSEGTYQGTYPRSEIYRDHD